MERLRKVLSGMIALTMTASLAACGNDDAQGNADGADGAGGAVTEAAATTTTVGTVNETSFSRTRKDDSPSLRANTEHGRLTAGTGSGAPPR